MEMNHSGSQLGIIVEETVVGINPVIRPGMGNLWPRHVGHMALQLCLTSAPIIPRHGYMGKGRWQQNSRNICWVTVEPCSSDC